jgi:hypothetical protein
MSRLLRIEQFRWQGQAYETWLIQRAENRYMAKTKLGIADCIITDADNENEVLGKHRQVLPVALMARGIQLGEGNETSSWLGACVPRWVRWVRGGLLRRFRAATIKVE